MAAYLVVAHQTAASPELIAALKEVAAADAEAQFVLLVPATETHHLLTWVEGDREQIARSRANDAANELRRAGLKLLDTVVGPSDPLEAIKREVASRGRPFDRVIVSTLSPGVSRWLRRDLPTLIRRQLGMEVTHVFASPSRPGAGPFRPELRPSLREMEEAGEPLSLQQLAAWRGQRLYCVGGDLGQVCEILYDHVTSQPAWIGVESRPLPFRMLLVPALTARVVDGYLMVPYTTEKVLGQPHVLLGEGFSSLTEEQRLYDYFGLPQPGQLDIRVLRIGQPYPGSQRNWQNIMEETPRTGGSDGREKRARRLR